MSLKGKTVLVTRPRDQAASLVREIERRGGRAVVFPAIEITEPDSWSACDEALRRLTAFDAVVFTSTNGVRKFFERMDVLDISRQLPAHIHVIAVGKKTQAELEGRGCAVHMIPETHNTPALTSMLGRSDLRGKRILLPRGQLAGELLVEELQSHGAVVEPIVVYNTVRPDGPDIQAIAVRLMNHEIDVVTFASPSAVYNFVEMMEESSISGVFKHTRVAVIGPTTEEAVRAIGLQADIVAPRASSEDLAEAINNSL